MSQFSLKDALLGMTFAAIGFGMLAFALNDIAQQPSTRIGQRNAYLVAFGGVLAGYGIAFPVRPVTYRLILAMVGMFAAQAWQSGIWIGLLFYVGALALLGLGYWLRLRLFPGKRWLPEEEHDQRDNMK